MKTQTLKRLDRVIRFLLRFTVFFDQRGLNGKPPDTILIIKLSAMGDALCLVPTVRALSELYPKSKILWLTTNRTTPDIFRPISFMSDQFVLPTALLSLPVALIRLGLRLRSIDLCINFDQYYALSELFARTTKFSIGFKHDERRCYTSVAVRYDEEKNEKLLFHSLAVAAAKSSGLKLGNISFSINEFLNGFSPSLQLQLWVGQAKALKKPTVILYPGSSPNAAFRRWGTDKYQALARRLTQNGYLVIIAGGPDEQGMVAEFHDIDRLCFNMIGQWSLRDWFWIFKTWPDLIFCGTDAGLYHLADLSGLLVIGLFGPNSQKKWGSLNPNSRDLDLTVPCSPCIHNGLGIVPQSCKVIHRECLTGISVSDVFERINSKPSYP